MDTLEERWETAGAESSRPRESSSKVSTFWFTKIVVPGGVSDLQVPTTPHPIDTSQVPFCSAKWIPGRSDGKQREPKPPAHASSSSKVSTFWFTKIVVPGRCERPPRCHHRHLPGAILLRKMDTLEERWETAGAKAPAHASSSSKVSTFWFTKIVVPGRCERVRLTPSTPPRCHFAPQNGHLGGAMGNSGSQSSRPRELLLQGIYVLVYRNRSTWEV